MIDAEVAAGLEKLKGSAQIFPEEILELSLTEAAERLREAAVARSLSLAGAESLTGGLVAATITAIAGASDYFRGSVVSYAVTAKERVLHVPSDLIEKYGVVSEPVALAMARAAKALFGASFTYGCSGYAGPTGEEVGKVCFGFCLGEEERSATLHFTGERAQIREKTVEVILRLLLAEVERVG